MSLIFYNEFHPVFDNITSCSKKSYVNCANRFIDRADWMRHVNFHRNSENCAVVTISFCLSAWLAVETDDIGTIEHTALHAFTPSTNRSWKIVTESHDKRTYAPVISHTHMFTPYIYNNNISSLDFEEYDSRIENPSTFPFKRFTGCFSTRGIPPRVFIRM